ncbi:MAG: winged helix-turn-helix transcriptional regulator [Anaerolineaceae bacterium]|nr:winged helix-turn-helix transcriptional regulator [Anaerolineaceae bacterium]
MTEGPYRIEETSKHLAVCEAIANCLVNTDYFQPWSVVLERYPDKIVLSNPGTILTGKKQMLKDGISEPRNKNMLKMFNLIGIGEHAGSGVPDIFDVWKTEGLDEPIVEEQFGNDKPDRTTVILPLISSEFSGKETVVSEKESEYSEKGPDKLTEGPEKGPEKLAEVIDKDQVLLNRAEAVYNMIEEKPTISRKEISERLHITDKQVRTALKALNTKGLIHREGPDKGGIWVIDGSYFNES